MSLQRGAHSGWPYRWAIAIQALIFHRQVLFYPRHLFPWDFRGVHVPLATLMADAFRRGQWPLWDPFTYCGVPIFANIQAASFYPPVLAATALASRLGDDFLPKLLAWSVVLQIIFAGLCTFQLMRKLEASPAAAWIGATVFELGCFFAAQPEHMGAMQGAVWLPLIWLSVIELRDFRKKWLAVLIVSLAMTILAGLPQVAVGAFGSAVALAVLLRLFGKGGWKPVALVPAACVAGVLLAAIQFFPTAELTQNSVAKYRAEWLGSGGGIPPAALLSLVSPNHWSVFDPSRYHGPEDLTFVYLYSSLLGLALAIGAMLWRPGKSTRVFTALLAVFTFAMLGDQTAPGRALLLALPVKIRIGIHPEFFFCVFSLALAVLAGLGAEKLLRSPKARIAAGLVIACDLILVSSGRPMNQESMDTAPGITREQAGGSAELLAKIRDIANRTVPPGRYDTLPGVPFLWSSTGPVIGVPTSNGCDPLAPERTIELRRAFANGPRWGTCYQVENASSPVVSLMNARVLLSQTALDIAGLRLAGQEGGYWIYDNLGVMDRFFFAKQVRSVSGLSDASAVVRSSGFRPKEVTVVEAPGQQIEVAPDAAAGVRVISYEPTRIRLETESSGAQFLVDADSYYPGWQASIDGQPTQVYAADAAFRGIRVPAGKHTVEFRFVPKTMYRSMAVSVAALAGVALFCLV